MPQWGKLIRLLSDFNFPILDLLDESIITHTFHGRQIVWKKILSGVIAA